MLFLLLVATANAVTLSTPSYFAQYGLEWECQAYADACDADSLTLEDGTIITPCATLEEAVQQCVDAESAKLVAAGQTVFTAQEAAGNGYAACSFMMTKHQLVGGAMGLNRAPYTLTNLYSCACANFKTDMLTLTNPLGFDLENGCEWNNAWGTWSALEICMDDDECVESWETVISQTSKLGTKYDDEYEPILGFEFPETDQDSKNFCFILFAVMEKANVNLLSFGSTYFALGMPNGGEIVEECNALMKSRILGMICGISAGVFVLTLIGACAYSYFCKSNKD